MNLLHCLGRIWLISVWSVAASFASEPLALHTRSRQPVGETGADQYRIVEKGVRWAPEKTAIIICDMWDRHWCKGATARVAELAPRMNQAVKAARDRGVFIIHAPSDTMKFYADWPQRQRAQQAPQVPTPGDAGRWRALDPTREPPLPIDDSDGGCDDWPPCFTGNPWKSQIPIIEIAPEDAISDSGSEVFNLLQQHGRDQIIIMGVHENMCVLGRSFAIRQMVTIGKQVVLMRDMTDTMYNSRRRPYVSHFVGTDLMTEHIEKYWCPTITSADLVGGEPFRFQGDKRPRIVAVIGEHEYHTAETLPDFAREELAWRGFTFESVNAPPQGGNTFTNWQAIAHADLLLVSARRRTPPTEMLDLIRAHVEAGKPVIGIRTASHAFAAKPPDASHSAWDSFDRDVFGARYEGHFGNDLHPDIQLAPGTARHPITAAWPDGGFRSEHSLYRNRSLARSTQVLLVGTITVNGRAVSEPAAWINTNAQRRVFCTSLGGAKDFEQPAFRRVLRNAILWAASQPMPPGDQ